MNGPTRGALVPSVDGKGPAAAAGIAAGDVILEFDGQTVDAMHELPRIVADEPVGKEVQVLVLRKGKEETDRRQARPARGGREGGDGGDSGAPAKDERADADDRRPARSA